MRLKETLDYCRVVERCLSKIACLLALLLKSINVFFDDSCYGT